MRKGLSMTQFDMAHLDDSCQEIFKSLSLGGTDLEKCQGVYNQIRASFNAEAVDFCCRKYITAELDYLTPGDRGMGRLTTYVPRLGAYHRKKMASLDASARLRLYNLIEDVMLRSYLTVPLFVEEPLREAKYVDSEVIFHKWIPRIYSSVDPQDWKLKILWGVAGFALENLMGFFAEHKMSGAGLFSKDRTPDIYPYYAIAGSGIRLVEIGYGE
jgi:hypothetical protein